MSKEETFYPASNRRQALTAVVKEGDAEQHVDFSASNVHGVAVLASHAAEDDDREEPARCVDRSEHHVVEEDGARETTGVHVEPLRHQAYCKPASSKGMLYAIDRFILVLPCQPKYENFLPHRRCLEQFEVRGL
jgi:hypothetical protein